MGTLAAAIHATVYRGGGDFTSKFSAAFRGSIKVSRAINPTVTFTTENTAQEATVVDHLGWLQRCRGGEARFPGCRRGFFDVTTSGASVLDTDALGVGYGKHTTAIMTLQSFKGPSGANVWLVEDNYDVASTPYWSLSSTENLAALGASVLPDNAIVLLQCDIKIGYGGNRFYLRPGPNKPGNFPVSWFELDGVGGVVSHSEGSYATIGAYYFGDGWYRLFALCNFRSGATNAGYQAGIGINGGWSVTYDGAAEHKGFYISNMIYSIVGQAMDNNEKPSIADYLDELHITAPLVDQVAESAVAPDGVVYKTVGTELAWDSGTKILTTSSTVISDSTIKGILIEPGATNELTYSQDFSNAAWTNITGTITRAALTSTQSPDRMRTGWTLTPAAAGNTIGQSTGALASTLASASVFLKAGTSTSSQLILYDVTGAAALATVGIAWSGGVPTVSGVAHATAHAYANGWYRICIHGQTITSGNVLSLRIVPDTAGTGTVLAWGAQVEHTVYGATSYIPTTTAVVTRTADVFTMAKTNITTPQLEQKGSLEGVVCFPDQESDATRLFKVGTAFLGQKSLIGVHNTTDMLSYRSSGKQLSPNDGTTALSTILPASENIASPRKFRLAYSATRGNYSGKMEGGVARLAVFDGAFGSSNTVFELNNGKYMPFCCKSFSFWNVDKGQAWNEAI